MQTEEVGSMLQSKSIVLVNFVHSTQMHTSMNGWLEQHIEGSYRRKYNTRACKQNVEVVYNNTFSNNLLNDVRQFRRLRCDEFCNQESKQCLT